VPIKLLRNNRGPEDARCHGEDERWSFGNRGGVVGAVRIEYAEDAPQTVLTDGHWKVADRKEDGWERKDIDEASWKNVQTWFWKGTGIAPWNLFDKVLLGV
jgi:hypothetical protein